MKVFTEPKINIVKFSDAVGMGPSRDPEWTEFSEGNTKSFNMSEKIKIIQYDFFE